MTEPVDPNTPEPYQPVVPYLPPPVTQPYPVRPYPVQPFPAQPYYGAQPIYGPTPIYPMAPGYPAYPGYLVPDQRPSSVMAAVVLSYVAAGLIAMASFFVLIGASIANEFGTRASARTSAWLTVGGVTDVVIVILSIVGGSMLLSRKAVGRTLLTVAAAIDLGSTIGWLSADIGYIRVAIPLAATLLVAAPLTWQTAVTQWLRGGMVRTG